MGVGIPSLKLTFSHLKMDGWNTSVSFWDCLFSGGHVSFREGTFCLFLFGDCLNDQLHMGVSKKRVGSPNPWNFNRIFHYKVYLGWSPFPVILEMKV